MSQVQGVPWKAQGLQVLSRCAERLRPERLGPNHRPPWVEPDRRGEAMSVSEAVRDLVDDTVESSALVPRNGFHLEPRCRICRNDQVRTKVNDMLATGASYAMVLRALGDDNAKLEKGDRVTIDSIRNHTVRHFRFSRWPAPPTAT